MKRTLYSSISYLVPIALGIAAPACVLDTSPAAEETVETAEPLSAASFAFQQPTTGSTASLACSFNTKTCFDKTKYHTGIDRSATSSIAIRASNYGQRSFLQNMSASDHGMGNAVGVRYLLSDGTWLYAFDNHLASHQPLATRPDGSVTVPRGAKLGNMGGSGYGSATYWSTRLGQNPHDHHENKTGNTLANACGSGTYYGYTPSSALNFCYRNPDSYFNTRRVLIPEFSLTSGGWGDYDVTYAVAGRTLYSRVVVENAPTGYAHVGVGGRAGWSTTIVDFPLATNTSAGSRTYVASRTLAAGDYRFFGAVQAGTEWRTGYPVIFTVVPTDRDFVRDNDMYSPYFTSGGLGVARFDGYGYGAYAAAGNSGAWARWYTQRAGTYSIWAYVGGNGSGSARFKLYPTGSGTPIYANAVSLSPARYGWVQLAVGATNKWTFTTAGYVGLVADTGNAGDVILFDAVKFIAQ